MRKVGQTLLALPVLAAVYAAALRPRGVRARLLGGLIVAGLAGAVVAGLPPAPSTAVPASSPRPVAASLLDSVRTGHALTEPFRIAFDAPMDAPSVAAALRLVPDSPVAFAWDPERRRLTITPVGHWQPHTLYTVSVGEAARGAAGGSLARELRAVILTAPAGTGVIEATRPVRAGAPAGARAATGAPVRVDTAIRIRLDRPVPPAAVRLALRTEPGIPGALAAGEASGEYLLTPAQALAPGTTYRVWLAGLEDADGVPFGAIPEVRLRTAEAPRVVRFRPADRATKVAREAVLSVRFSEPMDRAATGRAFRAVAGGDEVQGRIRWAEGATVLVFTPAARLPYGASVTMAVGTGARSRTGSPLAAAATGGFRVEPKPAPPAPPPPPRSSGTGGSGATGGSGGTGAASGSWTAVESYYLRLMNCTRTGGLVTSTGACSSPGGRDVAPLARSAPISDKVSRPYARLLATRGACSHFIGGTPGDRLRRAGFTSYRWAENLGCRSGNPYAAVLGSHLYFQSERSWDPVGGHYRNLMNPAYDRAGIGVWVDDGRVRLVVNFYHP